MRHYLLTSPQPVTALPRRMKPGTAPSSLVAPPGRAQRIAPAHVRTPPCAVPLAAIAAAAQAHLHPAPPTAIVPMTRLLLPLHASSPGTGQRQGKAGIKGPQHRLSQALRTEGPGVDGKSVPGPRFFSICLEAYSGARNRPPSSISVGGSGGSCSSIHRTHRKLQNWIIPSASNGCEYHPSQNLLGAHRRRRHRRQITHSPQDGLLPASTGGLILESASVPRGQVPEQIRQTAEFRSLCPATAACLSKAL